MAKILDNKKAVRFILAGLIIVILGFGAVFFLSGIVNKDKDAMVRSTEASSPDSGQNAAVEPMKIDSSAEYASKLFKNKAEDTDDTASVVKLLETMGLEDIAGEYSATITTEKKIKVLTIKIKDGVEKDDKSVLDGNMEKCSQQIMALIPEVEKVQWTYSLNTAEEENETVTVSLDEAGANKQLSKDVKDYGESAETFRDLLIEQAGGQ